MDSIKLLIARDKDGELTVFEETPKCSVEHGVWYPEDEQKILSTSTYKMVSRSNLGKLTPTSRT